MLYLELKYINLISSQLDKFKKRNNTWNFRCPYCGDSEKNPNKTRGYLYVKGDKVLYHCHNCKAPHRSFEKFLKFIDANMYSEYMLEKLKDNNESAENIENFWKKHKVIKAKIDVLKEFPTISDLSPRHKARLYLNNRQIPYKFYKTLFYIEEYKSFVNSFEPTYKLPIKKEESRILIPFLVNNTLIGFQGRALDATENQMRYITTALDRSKHMVYGYDTVDFNKPYFITEGPFDSMFLENSMAVSGSDIGSLFLAYNLPKNNAIIIFDNEPRNKEIVGKMQGIIDSGYKICIWPSYIQNKDINDIIVKENYSSSILQHIIENNAFTGMEAKTHLINWKRV